MDSCRIMLSENFQKLIELQAGLGNMLKMCDSKPLLLFLAVDKKQS